jgi:DNA-binding NarL/FixJ family response regulator
VLGSNPARQAACSTRLSLDSPQLHAFTDCWNSGRIVHFASVIRILVADDHEVIRAGVRTILSARGDIEVYEACDGAEAVRKAMELNPDLVIMDLTMPVMGGYAAAGELRRLMPQLPILFFSIHDGATLIRDAKRVGARGFLNKRDASETLVDAVNELVVHKGTFFPDSAEPETIAS